VGRDAIIRQFERLFADWSEYQIEEIEVAADSGDPSALRLKRLKVSRATSAFSSDIAYSDSPASSRAR
jgi:hypothetical protein